MENNFLAKMPGYSQIEYLIILNPHDSLRDKIMKIKNGIHLKYNTLIPLNGKPNIRLAKFFSWETMEEKLTDHLRIIAMGMPPFKVSLKDYGGFPSHTLFINVTSKVPIQMLMKEIRATRPLMKSPTQEPAFASEFYIPLAVKLTSAQYEKIWLEYHNRRFTGSFIADSMLLLKRRTDEKNYQIANRFEFMNLPVSIKQGELFA